MEHKAHKETHSVNVLKPTYSTCTNRICVFAKMIVLAEKANAQLFSLFILLNCSSSKTLSGQTMSNFTLGSKSGGTIHNMLLPPLVYIVIITLLITSVTAIIWAKLFFQASQLWPAPGLCVKCFPGVWILQTSVDSLLFHHYAVFLSS